MYEEMLADVEVRDAIEEVSQIADLWVKMARE